MWIAQMEIDLRYFEEQLRYLRRLFPGIIWEDNTELSVEYMTPDEFYELLDEEEPYLLVRDAAPPKVIYSGSSAAPFGLPTRGKVLEFHPLVRKELTT